MNTLPCLSVSIITFDEEENIARTLESISGLASEIIVVDSGSTDNTIIIAAKFGAKIFIEDWKGHIAQKNSALDKCSSEWLLMLDADEVVSDELKQSITDALRNPQNKAYYINRRTFYLGKLMKRAWQPDRKLRLVHKSVYPRWKGLDPHDFLEIEGYASLLKGDIIHYSYRNLHHHFRKTIDYARISADSYFKSGRRFSMLKLLLNPLMAFIRLYFLRLGIIDGTRGFIAAFSSMFGTFMKHAFLLEKELREKFR